MRRVIDMGHNDSASRRNEESALMDEDNPARGST